MDFFSQEINFDIGHLILLIALFGFIFYVVRYCRGSSGATEGLEVAPVIANKCKCSDCAAACFEKVLNNEFYGCRKDDPLTPYSPQQCEYEYRKCVLHGCGQA